MPTSTTASIWVAMLSFEIGDDAYDARPPDAGLVVVGNAQAQRIVKA